MTIPSTSPPGTDGAAPIAGRDQPSANLQRIFVGRNLPVPRVWRLRLLVAFIVFQSLLLVAPSMIEPLVDAPGVSTFTTGQWVPPPGYPQTGSIPPGSTELSTPCFLRDEAQTCRAIFRIDINSAVNDPALPLALLMPYWRGEIDIYLNGNLLFHSRWIASPHATFQPPPIYQSLPPGLMKSAGNYLQIETTAATYWGDAPGPLQVGPEDLLYARYQALRVFAVALPQAIDAVSGFAGILIVVTALLARGVHRLALTGILLVLLSQPGLTLIFPGASADHFFAFSNHMRLALGPLVWAIVWVWRHPSEPLPWLRRLAFLVPVVSWFAGYFVASADWRHVCGYLPLILLLPTPVLAVVEGWRTLRRAPSDSAVILWLIIVFAVLVTLRDLWWLVVDPQLVAFSTMRYGTALITAALLALVSWQFLAQLHAKRDQERWLKATVDDVTQRLRLWQNREKSQMQFKMIVAERERLMRDLHDGLVAQLKALQRLCIEEQQPTAARAAQASQLALIDLRLVVASMEDAAGELSLALAAVRETLEPFLHPREIRLSWHVRELPPMEHLNPGNTLRITRALAEVICHLATVPGTKHIRLKAESAEDDRERIMLTVEAQGAHLNAEHYPRESAARLLRQMSLLRASMRMFDDAEKVAVVFTLNRHLPTDAPQTET